MSWDHTSVDDGWVLDDEPLTTPAAAPEPDPTPPAAPRRSFVGPLAGGLVIGAITMLSIAFAFGDTSAARPAHAELGLPARASYDARETHIATAVSEAPLAAPIETPAPEAASLGFDKLYAKAEAAERAGDHELALDTVDLALADHRYGRGLDFKARVLFDMGELEWALELANEAVMVAPQRASFWLTKAQIHHELTGHEEATRFSVDKVLELAPDSRYAERARALL